MTKSPAPRAVLPQHPSEARLRKLTKVLAKAKALKLGQAQRRLAQDHGFATWAALIAEVRRRAGDGPSALSIAARRADLDQVEGLLASGAPVDGGLGEVDTPLYLACGAEAPVADRLAVAARLIAAGAFVRAACHGGETPLHAAARAGSVDLVRLLLNHGALTWQADDRGRRPEDMAAADGPAETREAILDLCATRPRIADPDFATAVSAIHAGDVAALARILDTRPDLLTARVPMAEGSPTDYFSGARLFWFIANNPTLVDDLPDNIEAIAEVMIARGIPVADLAYALGLVMTNGQMPADQQLALAKVLMQAGAVVSHEAMMATLGHGQTAVIAWLTAQGRPLDAPTAAGLGRTEPLAALLATADQTGKDEALAVATINRQADAVRLCLGAGADPNRYMPVHRHSTPLHQAALEGDLAIMALLVEAGARLDTPDTLWRGSPLGWAEHGGQAEAAAWLRARGG